MIKKDCDKNCKTCQIQQQSYCAAQMACNNQDEIASIKQLLQKIIDKEQIEPVDLLDINKKDEELPNPLEEEDNDTDDEAV